MITGDREQLALRIGCRIGPIERQLQTLLVVLTRRLRITLVAAHDEHAARLQTPGAAYVEALLRQQIGHRVGGFEAVAQVGNVVDPDRAFRVGRQTERRIVGLGAVVVALDESLSRAGP